MTTRIASFLSPVLFGFGMIEKVLERTAKFMTAILPIVLNAFVPQLITHKLRVTLALTASEIEYDPEGTVC
ncbi:MAG: hypothetical protein JSC188_000414 [Candidatus Tokpelaia sp. JSC188]|nr:MAG: hypothetical protein JSC188_000414 [Candidatus Tokpelaia sp. JSC188]